MRFLNTPNGTFVDKLSGAAIYFKVDSTQLQAGCLLLDLLKDQFIKARQWLWNAQD